MKKCHFNLINNSGDNVDEAPLRRCAEVICADECLHSRCEINLMICTDADMKEFNRLYRGDNSLTDVLTFSSADDLSSLISSGVQPFPCDIIIDINQLDRQKGLNNMEDELMDVFIHGLLHAFGYDHIRRQDINLMKDKEIKYKQIMDGIK